MSGEGEEGKTSARAETNHSGNSHVSVSLDGGAKAIIYALVGVAVILLLTVPVAKGADSKANATDANEARFEDRANTQIHTMAVHAQMTDLWMQRAIVACEAHGVKMPTLPAN